MPDLRVSDSGPHDLLADRPLRGWPEMTRRPVRAPEDLMRCLLLGNKRRREKYHEVFLVHIEDARPGSELKANIYLYH